ncbi:MAG: DUF4350 domain-containing protein [Opitutaceae bacterium]|nr:DUF4350 domain-containing protein [Opitutaceae bacterium]
MARRIGGESMINWKVRLATLLILGCLAWGVSTLIERRVKTGDIYPRYSSFRADPFGLRALHDALARVPGLQVDRWLKPLDKVSSGEPTTWVVAGLPLEQWNAFPDRFANSLEASLQRGDRWLILFMAKERPDFARPPGTPPPMKAAPSPTPTPSPTPSPRPRRTDQIEQGALGGEHTADWGRRWGISTTLPDDQPFEDQVRVDEQFLETLPRTLPWRSNIRLEVARGTSYSPLYWRGKFPAVLELNRGAGQVLIATDSFILSNERLAEEPQPALLSRLLGTNKRIVFVESHLGINEDPGMAVLARRYGMGPGLVLVLLTAALYIWRSTAPFLPASKAPATTHLRYAPTAGLAALLRRAVPTKEIITQAWQKWRVTASPAEQRRAAPAESPHPGEDPVSHYNRITRTLRIKPDRTP